MKSYVFFIFVMSGLAVGVSGCHSRITQLNHNDHKTSTPLTYHFLPRLMERRTPVRIEGLLCITTNENYENKEFVVIHSLTEPRCGGVRWVNAPFNVVKTQLTNAAAVNRDIVVRLDSGMRRFRADYGTNPLVDPVALLYSVGQAEYLTIPKVSLPPPNPERK